MKTYTKESLISALKEIRERGFIQNARTGNHGGIGNTLEDLLGIQENNLPMPNAAEWEIKTQRLNSSSLVTLFHVEPSPTAMKLVTTMLLPNYGWRHKEAGGKHPENEKSFRQTIHGLSRSDRGFKVEVDRISEKVEISFNSTFVAIKHKSWLEGVKDKVGLGELNPQPYWGFSDLSAKAGTKLPNTFFIQAEVMKKPPHEYYHYQKIFKLSGFNFTKFLQAVEDGLILVDFDARTGHNHGTKFRMKEIHLPNLYEHVEEI